MRSRRPRRASPPPRSRSKSSIRRRRTDGHPGACDSDRRGRRCPGPPAEQRRFFFRRLQLLRRPATTTARWRVDMPVCSLVYKPCAFRGRARTFVIHRRHNLPPPRRPTRDANVNKTELIDKVAESTDLNKAAATRSRSGAGCRHQQPALEGDTITLSGFGTFSVSNRAARTGRNPRTGEAISIAASKSPKFKAGKGLRDAVN